MGPGAAAALQDVARPDLDVVGPPAQRAPRERLWGPTDVVELLLRRGLLTTADVLAGLTVSDVSRRNHNLRVVTEAGRSFLVKQAPDPDKERTLANEARVYALLDGFGSPTLRAALPQVVEYLPDAATLLLELDPGAVSLGAYHRSVRRFPPGITTALGRAVAALHATSDARVLAAAPVQDGLPLVFSFDRPDVTVYYGASAATLQVLTAVHSTGDFAARLGELRSQWSPSSVIHADLRLDNCIVRRSARARSGKLLRLVDWEMAMWGDPAWDLATLLSEYLSLWLDHAPVSEATPPEQFLEHGAFTLDQLQPPVQQLWAAYRDARVGIEPAGLLWERAVRFTAARLVQTAYESCQFLADLPGHVVLKLQLAHNVLVDPVAAGRVLFGVEAGPGTGTSDGAA